MLTAPDGRPACAVCPKRGRGWANDGHISCQAGGLTRVQGNPHGIAQGWFLWPLSFDPVWLERCLLFELALAKILEANRSAHERLETRLGGEDDTTTSG